MQIQKYKTQMSRQVTNQLTKEEKDLLDKISEAWNDFLKLPTLHADDVIEYRQHVHAIQNIILARPAFLAINSEGR
jgi:hypothetical protein